jgi:hypothetical protein
MNKEADQDFSFFEEEQAISRFEQMLLGGKPIYFDVHQLEYIIDFYLDEDQMERALEQSSSALQFIRHHHH